MGEKGNKILISMDVGWLAIGIIEFILFTDTIVLNKCQVVKPNNKDLAMSEKTNRGLLVSVKDSIIIDGIVNNLNHYFKSYGGGGDKDNSFYFALELPSAGAQDARANRTMGMITGVIITYLNLLRLDSIMEVVTPIDVKKMIKPDNWKMGVDKSDSINKFTEVLGNEVMFFKNVGVDFVVPSDLITKIRDGKLPKNQLEHMADAFFTGVHILYNSEQFGRWCGYYG